MYTEIWRGNLTKRAHLEDPSVVWKIILRWIFRKCVVGMDWIGLTQDRKR
jgi:hypothetical protein